jgi:hypothetical protein
MAQAVSARFRNRVRSESRDSRSRHHSTEFVVFDLAAMVMATTNPLRPSRDCSICGGQRTPAHRGIALAPVSSPARLRNAWDEERYGATSLEPERTHADT